MKSLLFVALPIHITNHESMIPSEFQLGVDFDFDALDRYRQGAADFSVSLQGETRKIDLKKPKDIKAVLIELLETRWQARDSERSEESLSPYHNIKKLDYVVITHFRHW